MAILYIGLASVVLSLLMLWGVSKFMSQKAGRGEKVDVAVALRELLIAKAEGRIDPEEFERQQTALHVAVLQAPQSGNLPSGMASWRWLLPLVAVLLAGGVYWGFTGSKDGEQPAMLPDLSALPGLDSKPQANTGGDLNTVVKKLADKMANDPNNGEGWLLLAKTYGELRKYPEAAAAYAKAAALLPADATMLADWADAYVMSHERKWDDEARKIVKRAVVADPKHVKALALAGSEAFDRGAYKAAIDFWKRMKAAAPAESMDVKLADANIAEAVAMMSGKKPAAPDAAPLPAASGLTSVSGVLTVSAKMKGKISADDTVFVMAKGPDGGGAPLAVKRFKGSDLPIQFELDDGASIMPGRNISQFSDVVVTAKVSKSGKADQQAGDIYAAPITTKLGAANLKIELSLER